MLVYSSMDLIPIGYTDSHFQSDRDSRSVLQWSFSLWEAKLLYEEVSSKHVLMILPWKLNMLQLVRPLKSQFGFMSS